MEVCFVCSGPLDLAEDRPGSWLAPRWACGNHRKAATLPNGESIAGFLSRRAPADYPLEGSGLNFVINPVRIHGARAWLDLGISKQRYVKDHKNFT